MIPIDRALTDDNLFGAAIGDPTPWQTWRHVLNAAFGDPCDPDVFAAVAGDRAPPTERVRELWAVVGRRGGKSRIAALTAVYLAAFGEYRLAPGEVGTVLALAASRSQAQVVFRYCLGFLRASPVLRQEIASVTATEIRLRSGIVIAVHAGSYRTVRGRTLVGCVFDEVAFWRDETSATPDVETYRAVLPALATTGGMLIGISTPYRRVGLLHQKHRDHFGVDDPRILVVAGPTEIFNPTIDTDIIAHDRAADPHAAASEWDAVFRADISSFLDEDTIDAAVSHIRPLELAPRKGITYRAFVDPSGGRHDAFTIAIGHRADDRVVIDVVRGTAPPFDPEAVAREYATLAREYGVTKIGGDNYAGEWVVNAFRAAGATYDRSARHKAALYLEGVPLFMRGAVDLPNHPALLREMRLLERRTSRTGKDVVDHPPRAHDDHANAVFGAIQAIIQRAATASIKIGSGDGFGRGVPFVPSAPRQFVPPLSWQLNPHRMPRSMQKR